MGRPLFMRNKQPSPSCAQVAWQLGDIRRDPPRLIARQQLGRRSPAAKGTQSNKCHTKQLEIPPRSTMMEAASITSSETSAALRRSPSSV